MYKRSKKETLFAQGRFDELRAKYDKQFEDARDAKQTAKEAQDAFDAKELNYRQRIVTQVEATESEVEKGVALKHQLVFVSEKFRDE